MTTQHDAAIEQSCETCGNPVVVNALSPSECFCSAECADPEGNPCERQEMAQIIARGYGGSLYPGLGTPGDYPTDTVDYRIADAIIARAASAHPAPSDEVARDLLRTLEAFTSSASVGKPGSNAIRSRYVSAPASVYHAAVLAAAMARAALSATTANYPAVAITPLVASKNDEPEQVGSCEGCGAPLCDGDDFVTDEEGCSGCWWAMTDAEPSKPRPCYASRVGKASAARAALGPEVGEG